MSQALALPETAPSYLAALIAANPALALINQNALAGSTIPMPPSIVANKGKFTKKTDGVEETIVFPDNDANRAAGIVGMPVPQLQAVILKAKAGKEKAWYASKYTPGQEPAAPDCSSEDGIKPNAGDNRQCENCASCPQNVFGSGTDAQGNPSRGKACNDRKVVAVYAAGSAFRFGIPAASLGNWDTHCRDLTRKGIPLPAVITLIGFEQGGADYKLTFSFGGMLAENQIGAIVKMLDTPEVAEIVNPRGASALPAPAQNQAPAIAAPQTNIVDMDAEREKKASAEKAEADKKVKAAEAKAKKDAEAKAKAAAAATETIPGLDDLGGLGITPVAVTQPAAPEGQPSDDDLINSLGL